MSASATAQRGIGERCCTSWPAMRVWSSSRSGSGVSLCSGHFRAGRRGAPEFSARSRWLR